MTLNQSPALLIPQLLHPKSQTESYSLYFLWHHRSQISLSILSSKNHLKQLRISKYRSKIQKLMKLNKFKVCKTNHLHRIQRSCTSTKSTAMVLVHLFGILRPKSPRVLLLRKASVNLSTASAYPQANWQHKECDRGTFLVDTTSWDTEKPII